MHSRQLDRGAGTVIRHFTPTTLAAISVELEAVDRTFAESAFLDAVNAALIANVGEEEADQLRMWVREHV